MKENVVRIHRVENEATYPLVSHLPIPPRTRRDASKFTKTLRTMKVGDSFIHKYSAKGVSGPHRAADRAGVKITIRRIGDGYISVWRIA